jgi:hypothetical protein
LYSKKRRFRGFTAKATLFESFLPTRLANAGARKAAVVFDANLAAAEQIGYRRDGFLGVLGAGTDREDQITE